MIHTMGKIEFVIWGAGQRCEEILSYFVSKKQNVVAIVEGDVNKHGIFLNNIPIISKDTYLSQYKMIPIIVTPRGFEQEIIDDLKKEGIFWAFSYWGNTRSEMGSFCIQASSDKIINDNSAYDNILIYGWSVLTFLVYNFLLENSFHPKIILPSNCSPQNKEFANRYLDCDFINLKSLPHNNGRIILAMKPSDKDMNLLKSSGNSIESYYNLTFRSDWFYNPAIEQFHNIHQGKRGFVVANGPSLKISDLDLLHQHGDICIGMNRVYAGFPYTEWRPDYYILIDWAGAEFRNGKTFFCGKKANFLGDLAWPFVEKNGGIPKDTYCYHEFNHFQGDRALGFSDDFAQGTYWGLSVSYDALQLAVYLGFSEIYLIGQDCCNYDYNPEHQHFVKEYSTRRIDLRDELLNSYEVAKAFADEHPSVKIYNATRGGKLEAFKRVDFDSLFE